MARLDRSVRPDFHVDQQFARQYDRYVRESSLYQHLVHELLQRVGITKHDRVLCLAAGTGLDARAAWEASGVPVFGLDRSLAMAAAAREVNDAGADVHMVQADAAALPFPQQHFDVVLINAAGNYLWDSIFPLFAEVQRVLKAGGRFAFNCQSDEIEDVYVEDPQRQLRRHVYLLGWMRGYSVRLSAKPSVAFISEVAQATGLQLVAANSVRMTTGLEDARQQLGLAPFHEPFIGSVPEDKRNDLLNDAVTAIGIKGVAVDPYRWWTFFQFRKR